MSAFRIFWPYGQERSEVAEVQKQYSSLTPREQEVLLRVVQGMMNKQIGAHLNISEATVKLHRGNVMHKMRAESLVDLIRMAEKLGITPKDNRYSPSAS